MELRFQVTLDLAGTKQERAIHIDSAMLEKFISDIELEGYDREHVSIVEGSLRLTDIDLGNGAVV